MGAEKEKKKNKHTEAEWEQWYKEHLDEDTESSQTPRKPAEPETPPPAQRPRIRPGQSKKLGLEKLFSIVVHSTSVPQRQLQYVPYAH